MREKISIQYFIISIIIISLFASGGFLSQKSFASERLEAHLYINNKETTQIIPSQPTLIELAITDTQTGKRVKDFKGPPMMKPMHMVIINQDLSSFAHFHPTFDPSTGLFQIALHLPTAHPDNSDATRAILFPGHYYVYAEVDSKEFGIQNFKFNLRAQGDESLAPITSDPTQLDGSITKYFKLDGTTGKDGDFYQIHFYTITREGAGGNLVEFHLEIFQKDGNSYVPAKKLMPWLMMGGHAIVLSQSGETAEEKAFIHAHSDLPPESISHYIFPYFNRGEMKAGLYRLWGQVKHDGKVQTFPITFWYLPSID